MFSFQRQSILVTPTILTFICTNLICIIRNLFLYNTFHMNQKCARQPWTQKRVQPCSHPSVKSELKMRGEGVSRHDDEGWPLLEIWQPPKYSHSLSLWSSVPFDALKYMNMSYLGSVVCPFISSWPLPLHTVHDLFNFALFPFLATSLECVDWMLAHNFFWPIIYLHSQASVLVPVRLIHPSYICNIILL